MADINKDLPCLHRGAQLNETEWVCNCPALTVLQGGVTYELCAGCIFRDKPVNPEPLPPQQFYKPCGGCGKKPASRKIR